jgi:hypothetical protein
MGYDRSGFCITCQKRFENRYDHKKKNPGHIVHRDTAEIDKAEKAEAEEVLSAAMEEQASQKQAKKISGADFLSQPLFVATAGVGLGWVTAKALGPENALKQDEANGIAAGLLRIAGRHLLKEVDMTALSEANGDIQDALLIMRSVANYIARKWNEHQNGQKNESSAQAAPSARTQPPQQTVRNTPQNGDVSRMEQEAAFIQQQYAEATLNMPYYGQEAA